MLSEDDETETKREHGIDVLEKEQVRLQKEGVSGMNMLHALQSTAIAQKSEAIQKMLHDFEKIISLAQTPEDQAVIEAAITKQDFSRFPDPVSFIQTEIFDAPNISQKTQQAIAREFKITPYRVVTGSDVQNAFRETIVDAETGETHPRFSESAPLEYRHGVSAYNSHRGEQIMRFDVDPPVQFDVTGWNPNMVADVSEYGALFVGFQEAGISNFMVHNFHLPNALDPQFDPLDAVKSRQIVEALLEFDEGYDGKIYGADKTAYFKWFVQMLSPRGDWAQGDFDVNASHQALEDLGVREGNGDINLKALKSVGSYARGIYGTGAPNYYDLQQHLNGLYGDRVPLTGDNIN